MRPCSQKILNPNLSELVEAMLLQEFVALCADEGGRGSASRDEFSGNNYSFTILNIIKWYSLGISFLSLIMAWRFLCWYLLGPVYARERHLLREEKATVKVSLQHESRAALAREAERESVSKERERDKPETETRQYLNTTSPESMEAPMVEVDDGIASRRNALQARVDGEWGQYQEKRLKVSLKYCA